MLKAEIVQVKNIAKAIAKEEIARVIAEIEAKIKEQDATEKPEKIEIK